MFTPMYRCLEDHGIEPQFYCQDQVSIEDLPLTTYSSVEEGDHEDCFESSDEGEENDTTVRESELERVHLLLKGRELVC